MTRRRSGQHGPLSDEDVRLWELMKQRLEPLRAKPRVTRPHGPDDVVPTSTGTRFPDPRPPPVQATKPEGPITASGKPSSRSELRRPAPPPTPATAIEHRKSRRLAKGQRAIDAVLDLHGMRQREAHVALRHFIVKSHGSGAKFVKVVTGKGGRVPTEELRHRRFDAPAAGERGVLKRLVPEWLREPHLAPLVVGFSSAGRGHGGEGALYVELRRKERTAR